MPLGDFSDVLAKPPAPPFPLGLQYRKQPWVIRTGNDTAQHDEDLEPGLFYLDVFEHPVSPAQDESLREAALLGADTASRAILAPNRCGMSGGSISFHLSV